MEDGFEVRAIRENERDACLELWNTVWPGDGGAYFRRYFYGDRDWLPYYTQAGVLDGRIVSAVQICRRTVACGAFRLTMGGIANVSTHPDFRGRGYNTRCLQSAVKVMESDAMDFSLLFTGINDYYARQGFTTLAPRWVSGRVRPDYAPRSLPFTVRQATGEDLSAIQACYDEYNASRPIAVQRYPAYWRDWLEITPQSIPDGLLVAVEPDGNVFGYVQIGVFKSAVAYSPDAVGSRLIEYGTRHTPNPRKQEEAALALVQAVVDTLPTDTERILRADIALTGPIVQALSTLLADRTEHTHSSGMARLLHRTNLLQSMGMGLNDRWIGAGRPPGMPTFATPYGPVTLDATGTFLRVQASDAPNDAEGVMSQATLFGLLFGTLPPEQATPDTRLQPLLATLFPPQAAVYYGADGF